MSNKLKHKILSTLLVHFEKGEERTGYSYTVTNLGKSLSNIQIHKETNIPIKKIDQLIYALSNSGHVQLLIEDVKNKAHRYIITESGKQVTIDNYYPNIDSRNLKKSIFHIGMPLLTLFGLLFGIYQFNFLKSDLNIKIEKLEKKIDSLEKKAKIH